MYDSFYCSTSTPFRVITSPYGASRPHSLDTPHSVESLWTSDQPDAETSTWQHTTLTTDRHPSPRGDSNPQSQQASGQFDRHFCISTV